MKCSKCGKDVSENLNFCPSCGENLAARLCPNCGNEVSGSAIFCVHCGITLQRMQPMEIPTVVTAEQNRQSSVRWWVILLMALTATAMFSTILCWTLHFFQNSISWFDPISKPEWYSFYDLESGFAIGGFVSLFVFFIPLFAAFAFFARGLRQSVVRWFMAVFALGLYTAFVLVALSVMIFMGWSQC